MSTTSVPAAHLDECRAARTIHDQIVRYVAAVTPRRDSGSLSPLGEQLARIRNRRLWRLVSPDAKTFDDYCETVGLSHSQATDLIGIAEVLAPAAQRAGLDRWALDDLPLSKLRAILPAVRRHRHDAHRVRELVTKARGQTVRQIRGKAENDLAASITTIGVTSYTVDPEHDGEVTVRLVLSKEQWAVLLPKLQIRS